MRNKKVFLTGDLHQKRCKERVDSEPGRKSKIEGRLGFKSTSAQRLVTWNTTSYESKPMSRIFTRAILSS